MNLISASTGIFLVLVAPVVAAQSSNRTESLPDAYPACMERNGPDCVLGTQVVPAPGGPNTSSTVAPAGAALPKSGVVVITPSPPADTTAPSTGTSPTMTVPPGTVVPQGVVGQSTNQSATSTTSTPGSSTMIAPSSGAAIISPRAVR